MLFSAIIALSLRETGCESNYLFSFSYDSLCTSDYQDQSLCRYKRYRNRCHSLNAQFLIMVRIGVRENKRSCGCDKI